MAEKTELPAGLPADSEGCEMDKEQFNRRKAMLSDLINRDEYYVPMKAKEIAILLDIPKEQRTELQEVLDALVREGTIGLSKRGKYMKPSNVALTGVFEGTSKGFGFVITEDEKEDIFIKASDTNGAFYHDTVRVVVTSEKQNGRRREGKIIEVVSHEIKTLVGTYQDNKNYGFVVPDNVKVNIDIFVAKKDSMDAVNHSKVVVQLKSYGGRGKNPEGKIIEVLGNANDPGTDILSIIKAYDLPVEFSDKVHRCLANIPKEVADGDKSGRVDLRNLLTVTIDGEDAKDLDDAVTISRENNIYHLGVHIADVSHYVTEGSPLDKEALKRGTSVYLIDRVIPMLPAQLSNGICSLNQGQDRLTLSCLMDINEKGVVVNHQICESIINVDRRMSYTSVKKILVDRDAEEIEKYAEFVPMFELMEEAAEVLRQKRFSRGSIDFDFPESKIILDKDGHPVEIKPYDRNVATRMIEDFMLIANETVAEDCFWQELPFLYRTHENPDPHKMMILSAFINNFGYSIRLTDEVHPKELQKLLAKIEGSDEENLISRLTLRSMKKAKYTTECIGHFGLAAKYYCHFTSPIRRYPDLQIHRIIKENLHGRLSDERIGHYEEMLPNVAVSTSTTERRANDAERDVDKLKMVEYMSEFLGQTFSGVISGITGWGIYVELANTIEGMVSVNDLKGNYILDENHFELVEERSHKTYKLGQKVEVVVVRTDKILKTIDFVFEEDYNR